MSSHQRVSVMWRMFSASHWVPSSASSAQYQRADGKAAGLVEIASSAARVARERGVEPAPLMLAYWRDAAQWAKAHPEDGDAGMWRVENAAARLAADRLHAMGLPVAIAYAEPEA